MRLPDDQNGYTVVDGKVHTRYADHAEGPRTRTKEGAAVLGAETLCAECYPPPKPRAPAKPRQSKPRSRK